MFRIDSIRDIMAAFKNFFYLIRNHVLFDTRTKENWILSTQLNRQYVEFRKRLQTTTEEAANNTTTMETETPSSSPDTSIAPSDTSSSSTTTSSSNQSCIINIMQ
ncbi:MAG: hypothetical protein ACJ71P_01460 [Nitrososphaeraceae archaeon]